MAAFGDVTAYLTDGLDLTVGARLAENDQEFRQVTGGDLGHRPGRHRLPETRAKTSSRT